MILKFFLLIVLIFINGIFSATEIAFLSLNKYELNLKIKQGNKKAKQIARLLQDSSSFLSAIQIAITLSGFLASAFAAESFATEIADQLTISFLSYHTLVTILIVFITMILSYFTLVFGELIPKQFGMAYPSKIAFAMIVPLQIILILFKPFIFILKNSTNLFLYLLRVKKHPEDKELELKNTITDSTLEDFEKELLLNVFEFNDIPVKKAMTPIQEVVVFELTDSKEEVLEKIKQYKYTRFPVKEKGKIVGMVNVKDFILNSDNKHFSLKDYMRAIGIIKSTMILDDAFFYLNDKKEVLALVKEDDEEIGIVTLEDIIEELIGNIFDEYN